MEPADLVGKRVRFHLVGGNTRVGDVLAYDPYKMFGLTVEVPGATIRSKPNVMHVRPAQVAALEILR